MTLIVILIIVALFVIGSNAVRGYHGTDEPTHVCADCGQSFSGVGRSRAGWTYLAWPLNLVLAAKRMQPCPACDGKLIPSDSPKGKGLAVKSGPG